MPELDTDTSESSTEGAAVRADSAVSWYRTRRGLLCLLVVAVAFAGTGAWWFNRGLPENVAVRVSGTDVTVKELRDRMATVEALYGVSVPDDREKRDAFWRDAAHSVAVGIVLDAAADDEDVSVAGNQVDQSLEQVITSFFGPGKDGDSAFAQALATAGTSEKAVRDELRRQLQINALFASVTSDVPSPTSSDVASAYDERRCDLRLPEKRQITNIVVASRAEADAVLRRLRRGDGFAAVVRASSIDESTRSSGGDLGLVAKADLEKAYGDAAFSVKQGALFGPVKSEYGWNVGRVSAVRAGSIPTLEQATDQLKQLIFAEQQSKVWRDWLEERLRAADVRYAEDYAPEDPYALPAEGLPGATGVNEPSGLDC